MVELSHKILGTVGAPKEQEAPKPQMADLDLRSLIELGCVRDTVQIDNLTFVMRSLNAAERLDMAGIISEGETGAEKLFQFNSKLLAISIESVNGKPLELFHPEKSDSTEGRIAQKIDIIMSMQTPVLARLLEFYQEISDRCDAQFTIEQVKN